MRLILIAAVANNGVIGRDGDLPWRLPDDLRQFKERTLGRPVVMGRRTWESLRRALPGRLNIVLTRNLEYAAEGARVVHTLGDAIELARGEDSDACFVIGGAAVYAEAMERADALVITHVDADAEGDVRMAPIDEARFEAVERELHPADERHAHGFEVVVYERRPSDA